MTLSAQLLKLKEQLSQEESALFESLIQKINEVNGDLSKLSERDIQIIKDLESKYNQDKSEPTEVVVIEQESNPPVKEELPLLKTEFAMYVKDMLLRELGPEHKDLKSAVNFAYETKWIPSELKNPDVCETLFEKFFSDIEAANEWREEVQQESFLSNKTMAVGLTWFMYIFQLKKWVNNI